jgi:hypothetical protein
VIRRSRALAGSERLQIYVDAYYERLLECLREEFAATQYAAGGELFDALAFGYLQHFPSQSYTLNLLGANFPRYLGQSRLHERAVPPDAGETWPEFVIELATFERLQRDVFDAPGTEGRPIFGGRPWEQSPAGDWQALRLVCAPCLRLHAFEHPVQDYWVAWKRGERPEVPAARRTLLAIKRRNYVVERHELDAAQFALLGALQQGQPISQAIAAAFSAPGIDAHTLGRELRDWFAAWAAGGFFIELDGPERAAS